MKIPAFRDALARERDAVLNDALSAVKVHVTKAVETLAKLMRIDDPITRRLACNDILRHALKVRELEDFEKRIASIEAALAERDTPR